ncbi:MAG: Hpt domain-containing protein, partial [Gammaproteobacteria bacterium]|nr:Hpt domain-containing protein [Gammaproteobacteria bacterium]
EIFLEEAREIAVTAKDLLENWKSKPSDDASLIDLRRSFHTLKGSGRMSGAVEFGEFSWSFEELLNQIISGKVEPEDRVFAVCEEALDKLPSLLDDLEKHDESNINVDYWQESIEKATKANKEEEVEELEQIELVAEEIELEELDVVEDDVAEEAVIEEEIPGLPAALQSKTVRDIYSSEIQKHLEDLLSEVENSRAVDEPEVTDVMHRIVHTLRGSARSVGFDLVADTYESVENLLDGLSARSLYLTKEDIDILNDSYGLGMVLLESVSKPQALTDDLTTGLYELTSQSNTRLADLPNPLIHDGTIEMPSYLSVADTDEPATGQEQDNEEPVEVGEGPEDGLEEDEEIELIEIDSTLEPTADDSEEDSETVLDEVAEDENTEDDSVDELVEIFHEEAVDLLSRFHDSLQSWRDDPEDAESSTELKRIFHTIKGSARMTGITTIGDLAHNTESMLELAEKAENSIDEPLFELIEEVHDALLMMVENPGSSEFDSQADEMNRRILNHFTSDAVIQLVDEEVTEESSVEVEVEAIDSETQLQEQQETGDEEPVDELVEIFREEAVDLLSRLHDALESWREDSSNEDAGSELKRIFHTIKGSARMTGVSSIGDLAHNTESMLDLAEKAENNIDESLFELIEEVHDTLSMMVENPGSSEFDDAASEMNQRVLSHFTETADVVEEEPPVDKTEDLHEVGADEEAREALGTNVEGAADNVKPDVAADDAQVIAEKKTPIEKKSAVPAARKDKAATGKQAQVRVDADLLGTLANYAGEVSIARSRIQQQVSNFKDNLSELHNNIDRFQKQIRELEIQADTQISSRTEQAFNEDDDDFDPLEFDRYTQLQFLSRNLAESLHDLMMIQTGMDNFAGDVEMLLHEQSRLNTDLQEGLTQTRMVAFSTLMPRLRQLARKTSRELDKQINLELIGGEVELDRNVIDQVVPPLEHLIRNSISHGIENLKARKKLGKAEKGNLKLEIKREGKDIIIEFSDDGQGLDLDKIRSKAEQKGLLDRGMNPSDDHLANLIFVPGFSTADKVTQVSGRGVGMDVVQSELKQVGGSVSLTTEKNVGTRFSIRLPLSMTVAQAMIIASGGKRYAIPLMAILSITMVHRSRIITDSSGENSVAIGNETYPYISLAERLGLLAQLEDETKTPALMMNSATGPIVVGVDELIHATEIVVKSVGVQIASLDGVEGATVLGDGEVALIIDLVDLWNTRHAERAEIDQASLVAKMEEDISPATVMVVDDSLTVRRVTERNLSKYGITTLLATDGVDALEKLSNDVPDVMLVDIEMPRMDGFELTERVRDDPVYKNIPIIIITSRSGPKHRDKAMQLGATLYLTKPYQELELMNAINSVLPLESSRKISAMMES